jgi:hypothetical protein
MSMMQVCQIRDLGLPLELEVALFEISQLPSNWDGEGATEVSWDTILRMGMLLSRAFTIAEGELPMPNISPAYDGMLVAEWTSKLGREMILDISPKEGCSGYLIWDQNGDEGIDEILETDEMFDRAFQQFIQKESEHR